MPLHWKSDFTTPVEGPGDPVPVGSGASVSVSVGAELVSGALGGVEVATGALDVGGAGAAKKVPFRLCSQIVDPDTYAQ